MIKAQPEEHHCESFRGPDLVCEVRESFLEAVMLELAWEERMERLSTTTMENSMEIPQKTKYRTISSTNPTPGHISR